MTDVHVAPAKAVAGEVHVPGDKSVSHRALLLALATDGRVKLDNLGVGADVDATRAAIETLGAEVHQPDGSDPTRVTVTGVGLGNLAPGHPRGDDAEPIEVDARNAGTLARLLAGLVAGEEGLAVRITGDASLSSRPMGRIARPLRAMGASVELAEGDTLPMVVRGTSALQGGRMELKVASAQVQGAILLAALRADQPMIAVEPARIRDHTERMLARAGVRVNRSSDGEVRVHPVGDAGITLPDTHVPGDPSSAAPLIVAASVLRGSLLRLPGLTVAPGRRGLIDLLQRMGAGIRDTSAGTVDGEPIADLEVLGGSLRRTFIETDEVASMIDELPLLGLAAQFCRGETVVMGAEELRHKESDRLERTVLALRGIGIAIEERRKGDGFMVRGSGARPDGGMIDAAGDHRLAMLGGIAGLLSRKGVTVTGAECVDVSFPGFFRMLDAIAQR